MYFSAMYEDSKSLSLLHDWLVGPLSFNWSEILNWSVFKKPVYIIYDVKVVGATRKERNVTDV